MHPRTLQRRLREEGTTFEDIKDEARRDLAQRYLAHPDVPLAQVTAVLDYSEQSALTRSCQRWFRPNTPRTSRGPRPARRLPGWHHRQRSEATDAVHVVAKWQQAVANRQDLGQRFADNGGGRSVSPSRSTKRITSEQPEVRVQATSRLDPSPAATDVARPTESPRCARHPTVAVATVAVAIVPAAFWGCVVWLVWSGLAAVVTASVALVATMLVLGMLPLRP